MSNYNFLGSFLGKKIDPKKDGHDLSNTEPMSFPFGTVVPRKCQFCVPNERFRVKTATTVQTAPMREDNFQAIYLNQKAVFVPLDSICRNYLALTSGNRDTFLDESVAAPLMPTFKLSDLLGLIAPIFFYNRIIQEIVGEYSDYLDNLSIRWDYDSEGETYSFDGFYHGSTKLPSNSSNIYFKYISQVDGLPNFVDNPPQDDISIDFDDLLNQLYMCRTESGSLWCFDCLRILDSLGFGNHFPMMENFCRWAATNAYDNSYYPVRFNFDDQLIVFLPCDSQSHGFVFPQVYRNAYKLFAYQFAINSLMRSTYRKPAKFAFSVDVLSDYLKSRSNSTYYGSAGPGSFVFASLSQPFDVEMISNWTQSLHNAIFNVGFIEELGYEYDASDAPKIYYYLTCLCNPLLDPDLYTTMQLTPVQGNLPTTTTAVFNANPIQNMADLSALYKLRQDLLRSGVRRDKQMEILFGISDHDNPVVEPVMVLDSSTSKINIQGLLNQAETEVAPLGARGARGNGGCTLNFDFTSKDFGYIFFIDYFTCPTFYENFGLAREDSLAMTSWFNPRNNYLGLESVLAEQNSIYKLQDDHSLVEYLVPQNASKVIGWSFRDAYLKQAVNVVHGYFTSLGMPLYVNGRNDNLPYGLQDNQRGNAAFGGYIASACDQQLDQFDKYRDLCFNPYMLNGIFVNIFDGAVNGSPVVDQFRTVAHFDIKVVAPFPKMGLIKLD